MWLSQSGLTVDPVPPAPAHLTLENLIRAIRDLAYHDPEHTEKESSSRSCWSGDRLSRAWGRPVTAAEIAEELGESKRHVAEALSLQGCFAATSLEIGDELGVTQTQVSRILSRSIEELRASVDPQRDALAG